MSAQDEMTFDREMEGVIAMTTWWSMKENSRHRLGFRREFEAPGGKIASVRDEFVG